MFMIRALDRNEYNHITATYFLLAERKLRATRLDQANRGQQRPTRLPGLAAAASGKTAQYKNRPPRRTENILMKLCRMISDKQSTAGHSRAEMVIYKNIERR